MIYASRYLRLTIPNMQGPDVTNLQQSLQEKNFYTGKIDGIYGVLTNDAVKAFQEANQLQTDGIVGPSTWQALGIPYLPETNSDERIVVDLNEKILELTKGGKLVKTWPVAVGRSDTPTPIGNWIITQKTYLNAGTAFGTRWMRLSVPWGGYGIHGTNNPASIGTEASHGCVRMQNADVQELYEMVPLGTPVSIIGVVYTGPILKMGDSNDAVRDVQTKLQVLGYYRGDVDGVFGSRTLQAVEAFQKAVGLNPNGQVSIDTYNKLQQQWDIALGIVEP